MPTPLQLDDDVSLKIRLHAVGRAKSRYGLSLSTRDYEYLCEWAKKGPLIGVTHDWKDLRVVFFRNKRLLAVQNCETGMIHTFLPWSQRTTEAYLSLNWK
jgi:hypothetical protein